MRAALLRHIEPELPSVVTCSRCERTADDLLDRAHGERICGRCRDMERERYEAATGECYYSCGYALAYHFDADCPTEAQARARAGDR